MADLDDPVRLAQFRFSITRLDDDGVLEDCVNNAAREADAPIALVTFVMSKIQLFRAAVGLPPELAASRATSRCDSFCQFVVKNEGPFIVTDAAADDRVPKAMVDLYGIGAYLGVPIHVGGQVLGSLCVADARERHWRPGLVDDLTGLAKRVSSRLEEIASAGSAPNGTGDPGELSAEVAALAEIIQRSLVEVGPLVRLANSLARGVSPEALVRGAKVLTEASDFYDDMMSAVNELSRAATRLERAVAPTS